MNSFEMQQAIDTVNEKYQGKDATSLTMRLLAAQAQMDLDKADIASDTLLNMTEKQALGDKALMDGEVWIELKNGIAAEVFEIPELRLTERGAETIAKRVMKVLDEFGIMQI